MTSSPPDRPRILFRADADASIGTGHVMRCLALAGELASRRASCHFCCSAETFDAVPDLAMSGHELHRLDGAALFDGTALRRLAERQKIDVLVIDHYRLDDAYAQKARPGPIPILVIDDLPARPFFCDLLLDQTLDRRPADYDGLVPPGCTLLAGTGYALLRPQFAAARKTALARRAAAAGIGRILVSLGGTDPLDATGRVLDALALAGTGAAIDLVMGRGAPFLDRVAAKAAGMTGVTLHVGTGRMAELMTAADLAIGAAGTTAWERCCLGLPCLMLVIADNQRDIARQLAAAGAAILVDGPPVDPAGLAREIVALCGEPHHLRAMSLAAASVCDGMGASRVADALFERLARPPFLEQELPS